MTRLRFGSIASALAIAACALFPSLDSLTASATHAARDGFASDASDASSDGALCNGVDALVCTDFDHGSLLAGGWINVTVTTPNVLALDDASAYSAPNSLLAAQHVGASSVNRLMADLPPNLHRIHATMRLFVPDTSTLTDLADPFEILCGDDSTQKFSGFWLRLFSGGTQIWTQSGGQKLDVTLPRNAWTLFDIDVRYATTDAGAPSHVTVAVDGAVQIAVDSDEPPCAFARYEVNVGLAGHNVFSINADDVIVRVE